MPSEALDGKKYVILSDLHLGDGGSKDDLRHNKCLIESLLIYYLQNDYHLILNGDIEDLNKFSYSDIRHAWDTLFNIFHRFHREKRLIKIVGNHDMALFNEPKYPCQSTTASDGNWNSCWMNSLSSMRRNRNKRSRQLSITSRNWNVWWKKRDTEIFPEISTARITLLLPACSIQDAPQANTALPLWK
jgi:hypothetical protein